MPTHIRPYVASAIGMSLLGAVQPAEAQDQPTSPAGQIIAMPLDSGLVGNAKPARATIFAQEVRAHGAGWLRLHFATAVLPGTSQVVVSSLQDGEQQVMDGAMLAMWGASTAYFNGEALRIEIVAGPGEGPCRIAISHAEAEFGSPLRGAPGQCGICGPDDRAPVSDDSVGRLMPVGCSATIICQDSTGVSAGHCITPGLVMQFRVPQSQPNCSTVAPPVADQFPVIAYTHANGGVGADWAVMTMGTNSLGQRPFDRFGAHKPPASAPVPVGTAASIHGFGVDATCAESETLRESLGTITGLSATTYQFNCDVRNGNSGSSIVAGGAVIGIVTHCSTGCPNYGTLVHRPDFAAAIQARMVCDDAVALTVQSATGSAMPIAVSPPDAAGLSNGVTNFSRAYPAFSSVTLTATSVNGQCFTSWTVTGAPATAAGDSVTIQLTGPATATANSIACCAADCDQNSLFTPPDVACFINRWSTSLADQTLAGDFDGNGVVAPADVARFVAEWLAALAAGHC